MSGLQIDLQIGVTLNHLTDYLIYNVYFCYLHVYIATDQMGRDGRRIYSDLWEMLVFN